MSAVFVSAVVCKNFRIRRWFNVCDSDQQSIKMHTLHLTQMMTSGKVNDDITTARLL